MHPERWQRLKASFLDLVERDTEARESALSSIAASDPSLAIEVRDLLSGYDAASTRLLAAPAIPPHLAPNMAEARSDLVGTRLGPYTLKALVGGGGMGVVYEATRDLDGKRVAVKVLHGSQDDADLERQVLAERRILAGLEHENIARLIDGGVTPEGLPYFTMELVQGVPIGTFCEERQLDVAARLRLFSKLCAGVQYAHQRLVVHCDIKPGNVLVTDDGVPKLLDFGIARLSYAHEADPDAPTLRASAAMTPAYASPEQVTGAPLTTATDVYALGLLLYELLTGQPAQPLSSYAPQEIVRVVCETEPRRPSLAAPLHRRRQLVGDLDAIVLKALRKEPAQRFASAAALAEDLERHLNRQPVAARRGTWTYRASRFLRRNWLPAGATALLLALSLVTVVLTTMQSRRADRERVKAEKVTEFLVDLFAVSDPDAGNGRAITAREVFDTGARRIAGELKGEPDVQASLFDTIGRVYRNLGLYPEATGFLRQALALRRDTHASKLDIAASIDQVGRSLYYESKYAEAEALHRQALAMRASVVGESDPANARTLDYLGNVVDGQGRYKEGEEIHRRALALYRAGFGPEHPEVANGLADLANNLYDQGRYAESEALNRQALAMRRATLGPDHRLVFWSLNNLANALQKQGKYREAESMHREALAALHRLHGAEHPDIALMLGNLAIDLYNQNRYAESEALHRDELAMNRKLLGDESFGVAASLFNLAEVVGAEGHFADYESLHRQTLTLLRKLLGPEHPFCGKSLSGLAIALAALDRPADAEAAGREGLAIQERHQPQDRAEIAAAEIDLAVALAAGGKLDEAERLVKNAAAAAEADAAEGSPIRAIETIAQRYDHSGRHADAARCRTLLSTWRSSAASGST
jgi:eukaryotic-like serine/threonine-protein kinase